MRCPKCQYIGLGDTVRCRNCGYDFSLSPAADAPASDFTLADDRVGPGPMIDLPLESARPSAAADIRPVRGPLAPPADLPLFSDGDDAPLVGAPAVPRAPLAVRRPAPAPRPARPAEPAVPGLNLEAAPKFRARERDAQPQNGAESEAGTLEASAAARLLGGIIDALILLSIDAAVVYLTLRVTDLSLDDIAVLGSFPMIAFLLLLNGGYLVLFTAAGGQTIGKMAARTRVVADTPASAVDPVPVTFSAATVRGAAYLLSLLTAGAGLLPIVFGGGRALHDRLARTRVIKA